MIINGFQPLLLSLLLVFENFKPILGGLGLDIPVAFDNFPCLKQAGLDWAIVRAYHSYGAPDVNAIPTLQSARAAGFKTDVYMFPCTGGAQTAQTQVVEMIDYLNTYSMTPMEMRQLLEQKIETVQQDPYDIIWIDIEDNPSTGCSWDNYSNVADRCKFIGEVVKEIKAKGQKPGIYASWYMWNHILGGPTLCTDYADLPLWYPRYDGKQSMDDYVPFGGWTKPVAKQFTDNTFMCGLYFDQDYYPS